MIDAARAVIEFNRDLLGTKPRELAPMESNEYLHLGVALHEEFVKEFDEGWRDQDVIKMVDALLDGIYFAIGGLYKMGLTAQQIHDCFMHVHDTNMTKKRGQVASRATEGVADAVKPATFVPAEEGIAVILGLTE